MHARSISDVTQVLQSASRLMYFNVQNPTGHYRLDLSNPAEYSVAESLVLLDSWETAIKRGRGKVDVSQKGNWSQVRNPIFCDHALKAPIITEWLLPEAGKLELDYSSSRRPPRGASILDTESFQRMLIALQDQNFYKKGIASDSTQSDGSGHAAGQASQAKLPRDDMQALRMVAHLVYFTALQTRALLECFLEESDREDCVVTLFNRIADLHNEKVFSVRFGDGEQVNRLRKRLGTLVFFPWIQPEQANFALQLENFDDRTALLLIIKLATKERLTNIQRPRWIKGDGIEDPLTFGLPRSWEIFTNIPTEGTVYINYKCAPEDRNFKARKANLETYGNWPCDVTQNEVLWWASTNEVPVDVMEFLEFLIEDYDDVYDAFDEIKRPTSSVLTLRDFEQGLRRLNCTKFKGRREMEQIMGVFRYLDPSGEGQVSRSEWGILELLHKEMVYSIKEFVHFCQRSFGNDLNAAWAVFDLNGDNFISEAEWVSVARSSAYFGPTLPIFRFLDKDDEGTIAFEEFEELHKFHEPPGPDLQAVRQGVRMTSANGAMLRDLLPTRLRISARLARARAGEAGSRRQRPFLDQATIANLQKAIPRSTSTIGARVVIALEKLLATHGVKSRRVTMMKTNNFKEGLREVVCEIDIPDTVSPCGLQRSLQRALETGHPEAAGLQHALRLACAQVSTLQVEVRPSKERLVNNLRIAIPNIGINGRRADVVMEAALKCAGIYKSVLDETVELPMILARPSKCLSSGRLVVFGPETLRDPPCEGVQELSGLLALAGAAHQQLKETLAPGTDWAKSLFGDQVLRTHPSRRWKGTSLIPNGGLFDPGVKKRERLSEEVILAQRVYEQQDTAAQDLVASILHVHFKSLSDLCNAWEILETSLDVIWVNNRFREPDAFGYPCVQMGVRQQVQDPRYCSKECILPHVSEIVLHYKPLFKVKMSRAAENLHEELQDSLAKCGINDGNFNLAEAVVANVLDCTWIQMQRAAVCEVQRVLAFVERHALQMHEEDKEDLKALLSNSIAEAEALGCARSELLKNIARCSSHFVKTCLDLKLEDGVSPAAEVQVPMRRPVLTRISASVSFLKVERLQFHFKDGSQKVVSARVLTGDAPKEGTRDVEEMSFDLRGDYLVAVEQGPVGHSGSLGVQVTFFTAKGEVLTIAGKKHQGPPSRVRFEVQNAEQIVGLEVEFGRIVGIQTALIPEVGSGDIEADD